jgi:hypothetical protein
MSNKKQSSVEWLIENAEDFFGNLLAPSIIEQAKAMHEKEITDAYGNGSNNGYMYAMEKSMIISREQYYEQTFENGKD